MSNLTILDLSEAKRAIPPAPPRVLAAAGGQGPVSASAPPLFYGAGGDAMSGFRGIGGTVAWQRDLMPMMQWSMQRLCYRLYVANPKAHRIVELVKQYVVGEGVTYSATHPAVKQVIDEFWKDPVNRIDENLDYLVSDPAIFGESCWFAAPNPISGLLRIFYIDPYWIDGVKYATAEGLPGKAIAFASAVTLKRDYTQKEADELQCIQRDEDPGSPTYGQLIGNCFYFAVNKARSGHRGISDLFPLADWLQGYDQMMYAFQNQMDALTRFVWDVTLTGMTAEQVAEWQKTNGRAPAPNSVCAHNEKVLIEPKNPSLQGADRTDAARLLGTNIATGAGLPVHWLDAAANANRSTAESQDNPTLKMLTARSRKIKGMLCELIDLAIDSKVAAGALPEDIDRSYKVSFPELSPGDQEKIANALNNAVQGLVGLNTAEIVDKRTIATVFQSIVGGMGVEVDVDAMLKAVGAEALAQAARDATRMENYLPGKKVPGARDQVPGTNAAGARGGSAAPDGMRAAQ